MPRDGSQEYHAPFPDVVEGTTIESTVYNGFVNDVVIDLNTPRPVKYGGTGADNPADAMQNLGGELSKQLVTNYDAHPFQAGSFYSAAGASGAPVGNAFTGICYVAVIAGVATTDMFLEARDQTTGLLYVRQKKANVWGGWTVPAGFSPGPTPPVGSAPNALWWDTTRGKLFFYYQDPSGPPAQWVEAVAVPDIDPNTFVEIAGDSMTGFLTLNADAVNPLHAVPKQQLDALYAAPFDALAYNGMQINGSMDVSQELGVSTVGIINTSKYIADGWVGQINGTVPTINGNVVSSVAAPSGYTSYVQMAVVSASTSPGAADFCALTHKIEGFRISRLAWGTVDAQPITIGFWIRAVRPGSYSGAIRNGANDRSYVFPIVINVASTWEYKTATIPGDTTGTWERFNALGMMITFTMMAGSGNQKAAGSWGAAGFVGVTGTINGTAATTDIMAVTGVVVLPGIEAPSAARSPLIMRPYDQELLTCQRYYYPTGTVSPKGATVGTLAGVTATASIITGTWRTTCTMRATPAATLWNNGVQNQVRVTTAGSVASPASITINCSPSGASSWVTGSALSVGTWLDFDMIFDARL